MVLAVRLLIDPLLPDRKLLTWYSGRDTGYAEAAGSFQHEDDMGEALLITRIVVGSIQSRRQPPRVTIQAIIVGIVSLCL